MCVCGSSFAFLGFENSVSILFISITLNIIQSIIKHNAPLILPNASAKNLGQNELNILNVNTVNSKLGTASNTITDIFFII